MLSRIILLLFGFFITVSVSAESVREFHQRKCAEGNKESCKRAADMLEGERHAERIVELGDQFASHVDRSVRQEGKKPLLKDAYLDVMADYFKAEADGGIKQAVTDQTIEFCAEHFNNYWRNRKMWWPTLDNGQPDWSTIYYYIVEHYYGYCLRHTL